MQLVEGQRYEYEFNGYPGLRVRSSDVVKPSSLADLQERSGLIEPGNNTGLLRLVLEDANGTDIATAFAEVRSEKLSYREDYRRMLDFIADKSIDLISYIHGSLQTRLVPDPGHDPNTIQNRLAFVRSLISSDQFSEALERIIVMPHRAWQVAETKTDISKSRKLSRKALDQVFHSNPRTHLPNDLPLARRMHLLGYEDPSISRYVIIDQRKETTDTAENRFVKYILEDFLDFVLKAKKRLADMSRPTAEVAFRELRRLSDDLEGYLDRDFFKEISKPNILPLGSQVMQRKSGYREVFEAWIKFQYAAKLTWEGGDSVFGAGKRDLPTLYEVLGLLSAVRALVESFFV